MLFIDIIHRFNYFLNTLDGRLFTSFFELVIFTIIAYMIISEYTRTKELDLKYMSFAFTALAVQNLIMVFILSYEVFGQITLNILVPFVPFITDGIETIAICILAYAFTFPLIKNKKMLNFYSSNVFIVVGAIVVLVQFFWFYYFNKIPYHLFWGNTVLVVLEILLILVPIYFWYFHGGKNKYRYGIIIAFAVYLVVPVLDLINIIFYGNNFSNLVVAQTPFPFISVLLFTRIVYLRLVDKAVILEKLNSSEKKYAAEKELSKMKDEFVSVVSHELRTPLTSMKLHSSLLKEGQFGRLNAEQKDTVNTIEEEINRLNLLVNDILDMSKLESGKYKIKLENVDVAKIIKDNSFYDVAKKKGLRVVIKSPSSLIASIDSQKFRQLFINLLSNAVKYTEKGKITIELKESQKTWELLVSDTGKGIDKKNLPKLFKKFYQVDDYMTRTQQGTGLGLSIVKKIADMHKAKVFVDSKINKGSVFRVVFPKVNRKQ